MLEQQLANHILERYSAQLSPNQHFSSPLSSKLFSSTSNTLLNNQLNNQLTTSNTLLNNQLTTSNSLLGNHLCSSHFLGNAGSITQQQHLGSNSTPLILPRFNTSVSFQNINCSCTWSLLVSIFES